jgi:hypothetical protein
MASAIELRHVEEVRHEAAAHLGAIMAMFVPEMMVTLVVRHPQDPECHMVLTDDTDTDAVIALVRKAGVGVIRAEAGGAPK